MHAAPDSEDDWFVLLNELATLFSGAPIAEEDLFAGRSAEIGRALEASLTPSRNVIIFGERGVGKTSISNVFWRRYNRSLQTVIAARVQADPSDTFSSLWIKGLEELVSTAEILGRQDLLPISSDYESVTPDILRREFQKCKANAIPILIIDEFDNLRDQVARELSANVIKYLYDYTVNFTVIIVGVAENVSQLISDHESIRRSLVQIRLERMPIHELKDVIATRLSKTTMSIKDNARDTIVLLSRGLPYFTQMLGKFSAQTAARAKRLTILESDVEKALELFIQEEDQTFRDQYQRATESNQPDNLFPQALLACALAKTDDSGFFTATDVIQPFSTITGDLKTHAHFQRHLQEFLLDKRGPVLVRRGIARQYRYRFSDPMMQPYVIVRGIQNGTIPDQAKANLLQTGQLTAPSVL